MLRETFFERWRVAIAAFVAQALGPGLFAVYGLFVDPLSEAFGASHASLAFGMSFLLILQSAIGPILGPLLDRHSIRSIMLIGAVVAATAIVALSRAPSLGLLVLSFLVAVAGLTFYAPLPAVVLVTNHYDQLRGRALALAATGTSVAGMLLPLMTAQLLDRFDWRVALLSLASLVGGATLLAFLTCIPRVSRRTAGREAHSIAENDVDEDTRNNDHENIDDATWGFMRTRAFWIIGLTFSVLFGLAGFYAFSLAPHVREVGLEVEDAAWVMSIGATVSLIAKLGFASVADRLERQLIPFTVALIAIQGLAWFLITTGESLPDFILAACLFSGTIGPFLALGPYMNSLYFDEHVIGRVNGAQAPLVLPFALSAPPLAGLSYDMTGSYVTAFHGAITLLFALGILFLFLGRPARTTVSLPTETDRHGIT